MFALLFITIIAVALFMYSQPVYALYLQTPYVATKASIIFGAVLIIVELLVLLAAYFSIRTLKGKIHNCLVYFNTGVLFFLFYSTIHFLRELFTLDFNPWLLIENYFALVSAFIFVISATLMSEISKEYGFGKPTEDKLKGFFGMKK